MTDIHSFGEFVRRDVAEFPYAVWHEDGEEPPPKFKTWGEALAAQVEWNKSVPGHRAFRRKV